MDLRSLDQPSSARAFAKALLDWYDRHRRDLPWRREASPYRTLISELMLQQTVVATVVPYFERFVARLPDMHALAQAREDEVLALWSGLGYYSRGRNLHRLAETVVRDHGGDLPVDELHLRALPGVGPYTAAAVAAIAFGTRTFALDGNAGRVMARLHAVTEPLNRPATRDHLRALGTVLVPARRCGDFAQAVMELGALCCTPRAPNCTGCPVAGFCSAHAHGKVDRIPARGVRPTKRKVALACVAVERDGRLLLVRPPAGQLLGGTWILPAHEIAEKTPTQAAAHALGRLGLRSHHLRERGQARHVFTHRDVTATVFSGWADGKPSENAWEMRWIERSELDSLAVSSFTRKLLALLSG